MTDTFVSINGQRVVRAVLTVGNGGAWFVDLDMETDIDMVGAVVVKVGDDELRGTTNDSNGKFGLQRKLRVVAGAGGWQKMIAVRDYHNDAGVKALLIAQDAASAVGESIGSFAPAAERVGFDYVRNVGPASRMLEDVIGGMAWWVGFDGVTNVGVRALNTPDKTLYQVTNYDPRERIAQLVVDDLHTVGIGSTIFVDPDQSFVVRSFELVVDADGMRMSAWLGGDEKSVDRLAGLVRAIAQQSEHAQLFGLYKYRVRRMNGDRVELQVVRKATGMPDLMSVSMWPGTAGVHAELALSAEVLVQFIDGDRAQPIITHFAGRGGNGFTPISLVIGGPIGPAAARVGDSVQVVMPLDAFVTLPGPVVVPVTFPTPLADGLITSGSPKVSIA